MHPRIQLLAIAGGVALLPAPPQGDRCAKVEVEYVLAANLKVTDTPLGKGDGTYPIGPGALVLRFEGDDVKVVSYRMHESITVRARVAFWWATVKTEANNAATAIPCGSAAEAALDGKVLRWRTPVRNHRSDGTIACEGPGCGMFGAPALGTTDVHVEGDAQLGTFYFSPDMKTFTMPYAPPVSSETPKQTSQIAIAGREIRRTCVAGSCAPGR